MMTEEEYVTELYIIGLLERIKEEMDHCRVFVSTKERIYPPALSIYDDLHSEIKRAIQAYKDGKFQLHIMNENDGLAGKE